MTIPKDLEKTLSTAREVFYKKFDKKIISEFISKYIERHQIENSNIEEFLKDSDTIFLLFSLNKDYLIDFEDQVRHLLDKARQNYESSLTVVRNNSSDDVHGDACFNFSLNVFFGIYFTPVQINEKYVIWASKVDENLDQFHERGNWNSYSFKKYTENNKVFLIDHDADLNILGLDLNKNLEYLMGFENFVTFLNHSIDEKRLEKIYYLSK